MFRRLLPLLLVAMTAMGCRVPFGTQALGTDAPSVDTNIVVDISDRLASRRVQATLAHRASYFTAEMTGAGFGPNQWVPVLPVVGTPFTGVFERATSLGTTYNLQKANLNGNVTAGLRRIFKVNIWEDVPAPASDVMVLELWGVGDMIANQQNTVRVSGLSTPTAQIFQQLIQVDPAKAMTVPVEGVQAFVDQLLNTTLEEVSTQYRVPRPINPNRPMISFAVLDPYKAAQAIVRGNGGVPFQVPNPIPVGAGNLLLRDDPSVPLDVRLNPDAKWQGQVHLKIIDLHGDVITGRPMLGLVADPASETKLTPATGTTDLLFDEVGPGTWLVQSTDMERGGKVEKMVRVYPRNWTPGAGQYLEHQPTYSVQNPTASNPLFVTDAYVLTPPTTQLVAGTFDKDQDQNLSYNDEAVPAKLAYLGRPTAIAVRDGVVTFLDTLTHRVRQFKVDDAVPLIKTLAGSGVAGHRGDNGPAIKARITTGLNQAYSQANSYFYLGQGGMVYDKHGVLYIAQNNGAIRAVAKDGTMKTLWWAPLDPTPQPPPGSLPPPSGPPVPQPTHLAHLGYDETHHRLFVGVQGYARGIYQVSLVDDATGLNPAVAPVTASTPTGYVLGGYPEGGPIQAVHMAVHGGYVYRSQGEQWVLGVRIQSPGLWRYAITSGGLGGGLQVQNGDDLISIFPGRTHNFRYAGDDTPAAQHRDIGFKAMAIDNNGNFFYAGWNGMYRLRNMLVPTATPHAQSPTDPTREIRMKMVLDDPGIQAMAWDAVRKDLYIVTLQLFNTATGARRVPVIKKVVR